MKKYPIKTFKRDFLFIDSFVTIKGSRQKKLVTDRNNEKAIFKYERSDYLCSEACSEKLSYEIALFLGYECARIELAMDNNQKLGILNYLFLDKDVAEHMDAVVYLNTKNEAREKYYNISNIKQCLDNLNESLFKDFIKIMIFDALVGEQDRHEENWGVQNIRGNYKLSPLYDNGCNLLREFKNEKLAEQYYNGQKDFEAYIRRSQTIIYKDNSNKKFKHFELVEYLNKLYHDDVQPELVKLRKLTNVNIEKIVNKIPNNLLTQKHKEYIILYLIKRRDILLNMID